MQFNLASYLFGTAVGLSLSFFLLSLPPSSRLSPQAQHHNQDRGSLRLPSRKDVLGVAVLVGDNKDVSIVLNKTTLDGQRTTYFAHRESWSPEKAHNVVQMKDDGPMKYQVLNHMCSQYLNTTQWCVITDDTVYVQENRLALALLPLNYDDAGYASYHSGVAGGRDNGFCGHGDVEIVSHELWVSLCGIMTSCNGSRECVERGMKGVCSTASLLQIDGAKINCQKKMFLANQSTVCAFIHPLKTVEDLLLVHHLAAQEMLHQLYRHLRDLQVEIDQVRYLSSEVAAARVGAGGGIWDLSDLVSRYSLVQQYAAPKLPAGWHNEFDRSVNKVLALLNTTVYHKTCKVHSVYWRPVPALGVLYIINMEVESTDKRSVVVQAHLQLPVWYSTIGGHIPSAVHVTPSLTIVTVVSDTHYKELDKFVRMMQSIDPHHTIKLSLIVVRMGYMILTKVDHLLSSLHLPHMTIHVINDVQWTSRSLALALALQHVGQSDVVLLGDIQLQMNYSFLQRCTRYPVQGDSLYIPHILAHSTKDDHYHWLDGTDVVCVHGMDMQGVTAKDSTEVNVGHLVSSLLERGLNVLRGPDDGLLWIQGAGDCAGALIGEPCEGDIGDSGERYAVMQYSQSLIKRPLR